MTDILRPLSEYEIADLLGGYTDVSDGAAIRYFAALTEDDREIVQWYAEQGVLPELNLGAYVHHLVSGYHARDPERTSEIAKDEVTREMQRLGRYLELYIGCETVFPELATQQEIVQNEDGKLESFEYLVWIVQDEAFFRFTQEAVRKGLLPHFEAAQLVTVDATAFTQYMDLCSATDWNV